jgi:aspartate kinase
MLRRKVSSQHVTVMGGFIGATEDGVTTTLGRGGSDYTAAIAGAALGADEIQIWTDVDGMLTCDPRVVPNAHCLRTISFAEAELMAKSGAKVLHPATVVPAVRQRIPIVIRNSRNPGAKGTRIVGESARDGFVMSIACRTGVSLLRLMPRNTPVTAEFGQEIWDVFQQAGVQLDLVSMSEREMSVVVDSAPLTPEFRERLNGMAEVEAVADRAILTLVGHNAARNPSNLARASQRLCRALSGAQAGAILYCGCDSRFAFVLDSQALSSAAAALHEEFFAQPNPVLFVPNRVSINVVEARATARALVSANQVS